MPKPNLFMRSPVVSLLSLMPVPAGHRDRAQASSNRQRVCGLNGIVGALNENLIDTGKESAVSIAAARRWRGVRRLPLQTEVFEENQQEYERLMASFAPITYVTFFTTAVETLRTPRIKSSAQPGHEFSYQLYRSKTVDNDLPITDTCPGSVPWAHVAVSVRELDWMSPPLRKFYQGVRHGSQGGMPAGRWGGRAGI